MSEALRTWLSQELARRGWSYRELARQADISNSLVSRTMTGDVPFSADFCIKIAAALGISPVLVLVKAEILPPQESGNDLTLAEITDLVKHLTPENRADVLEYVRFRLQQQRKT